MLLRAARIEAQTPAPAPAREGAIQRTTLANGLQVFVVESHAVPLATVLIAVHNGAITQAPEDRGLAHLFEHILFRSYEGDPNAFAQAAAYLDAGYNGTTAEEVVTYYLSLPGKEVVKGIGLLAQLLQKARFDAHDLDEERRVVLDELQRSESDPEQTLARRAAERLWGTSWSRKDVGGDSSSLTRITVPRLQQAFARYYVPNNAALVITGDVSPAEVFAAAQQQFGALRRAADPFQDQPVPPIAPLTASSAILMGHPVLHATVLVQFRGPSVADTLATYAADALCDLLNERGSSFQHHLTDAGLFQTVRCGYETLSHVGPLTIRGETSPAKAPAALTGLLAELDGLNHLTGVTEEDLAIARKRRQVSRALALEASASLAPLLGFWWASGGVGYYEQHDARVDAQRLDDLQRFASSYIVNRPRVIGVLAPANVIQRLRTTLEAEGISPRSP